MLESPKALTAAAVLGLAGPLFAQAPTVNLRILGAYGDAGGSPRLPGTPSNLMMFDADRAIASVQFGPVSLADGVSVREIMAAGTPIPGQAPDVRWAGRFSFAVRPLTGRGAWFYAPAQGPTPQAMFAGDFDGSPFFMLPVNGDFWPATRTGLRTRETDSIEVGPIDGPFTTLIPVGFTPAGREIPGRPVGTQWAGINGAGAVSTSWSPGSGDYIDLLVADSAGIRTMARSDSPLDTDRGPAQTGWTVGAGSQPLADGSVLGGGPLSLAGAPAQNSLVLFHPDRPATVVMMVGDPAPGAGHGVTFSSGLVFVIATSSQGNVLFSAGLAGPGVDTTNDDALYLWRRGRLTLVCREAPGREVPTATLNHAIAVNDRGEVGATCPTRVILFRPGVGTVDVIRRLEPLPTSTGIAHPVDRIAAHLGLSGERHNSGGDDVRVCQLSDDGRFFFVGSTRTTSSPFHGSTFAASASITDPGCPADFNVDGFVDFFDYADFVECFEGGRCPDGRSDDFNNDDFADFFDYLDFVAAFETGC